MTAADTSGDGGRRRPWRFYTTPSGRQPVRDFLLSLDLADRAALAHEMSEAARDGLRSTPRLRGAIRELRAAGRDRALRLLFATGPEGLLALEGFVKKTERTPPHRVALAEQRLREWEARGRDLVLSRR